jgi:hypothetical protein
MCRFAVNIAHSVLCRRADLRAKNHRVAGGRYERNLNNDERFRCEGFVSTVFSTGVNNRGFAVDEIAEILIR